MRKVFFSTVVTVAFACAYFRTSIGEKFTATWCGPCHSADAYLEDHISEWEPYATIVCYHVFDSGLEIPQAYQRYAYYGSLGYEYDYVPHMFIDGWDGVSGPYDTWVTTLVAHSLAGSNVIVYIDTLTETLVRVAVSCEVPSISVNLKLIAVIVQDGVSYGGDIYNWVAETLLTGHLGTSIPTLSCDETVYIDIPLALPERCSPEMCKLVAYLEDPTTHTIVNGAVSSFSPPPPYRLEASASSTKKIIKPDSTSARFVVYVKNKGANEDVYTLSIIPREIPTGWSVYFDETGRPTTTFRIVEPRQKDSVVIAVDGVVGNDASFDVSIISGYDLAVTDTLTFSVFSPREWLVVNESGTDDTVMYIRYLTDIGADFVYWNTGKDGELRNLCGFGFDKIIWFCGSQNQLPLMPSTRNALKDYLTTEGGKLLLSGSWVSHNAFGDFQFYWLTLGASYVGVMDSAHNVPIFGTDASFIGYECHLALNETIRAEIINGRPLYRGVVGMRYISATGDGAAVVKDSLGYRTILFGFPIEKLADYPEFQALMNRCVYFLDYGWAGIEEATKLPYECRFEVSPNPFNASCRIFAPAGSKIEIYDINGRKVWETQRRDDLSPRKIIWTPDPSIKSGMYLVRISLNDGQKATQPILYVK